MQLFELGAAGGGGDYALWLYFLNVSWISLRRGSAARRRLSCFDPSKHTDFTSLHRRFHSRRFATVTSSRGLHPTLPYTEVTQLLPPVSVFHALVPLSNEDMRPQSHVTSDTHSISQKWKKSSDCNSEASSHCCLINVTRLYSKSGAYLGLSPPLSTRVAGHNDKCSTSQADVRNCVAAFFVQRRLQTATCDSSGLQRAR